MPQQFVNLPQGQNDYSDLLAQTQSVAARIDERQRRKAAQAALLKQMVDRKEIDVGDGAVVGDREMYFQNQDSRAAYERSVAPQRRDLTTNEGNSSTVQLLTASEDIIAKARQDAIRGAFAENPQMQAALPAIDAAGDTIRTEYAGDNIGKENFRNINNAPTPDATANREGAIKGAEAMLPIVDRQRQANAAILGSGDQQVPTTETSATPATDPATTPGPSPLSTTDQPANPDTSKPDRSSSSINSSQAAGEKKFAKSTVEIDAQPIHADVKASDRILTTSSKGANFYDEIQETLPSLRRAASLEAISAMFGGRDTPSPGQFNALADQRQRDLGAYNQEIQGKGSSQSLEGGLKESTTSGGNIKVKVSDASAGSTNIVTNVKGGNMVANSGSGNDDGRKNRTLGKTKGVEGIDFKYDADNNPIWKTVSAQNLADDVLLPNSENPRLTSVVRNGIQERGILDIYDSELDPNNNSKAKDFTLEVMTGGGELYEKRGNKWFVKGTGNQVSKPTSAKHIKIWKKGQSDPVITATGTSFRGNNVDEWLLTPVTSGGVGSVGLSSTVKN